MDKGERSSSIWKVGRNFQEEVMFKLSIGGKDLDMHMLERWGEEISQHKQAAAGTSGPDPLTSSVLYDVVSVCCSGLQILLLHACPTPFCSANSPAALSLDFTLMAHPIQSRAKHCSIHPCGTLGRSLITLSTCVMNRVLTWSPR